MGPGAAQAWQGQCCPTGTLACAVWENPNSAINKSIWQQQHWEGVTSFFGASRTRSSCGSALLPLCHPGDKDTFMTPHVLPLLVDPSPYSQGGRSCSCRVRHHCKPCPGSSILVPLTRTEHPMLRQLLY